MEWQKYSPSSLNYKKSEGHTYGHMTVSLIIVFDANE